ncbi:MAG: AAA family ATPase [Mollicutes bacterium]|nr:MAG: AAA family ATPase [Mollicutes bacterium]
MLKKIRIKNFKSIQDSGEIDFSLGITVLVGQNESGKTSILEAINYFGKFFHNNDRSFESNDTLNEDLTFQNNEIQTAEFTYSVSKNF